MTLLPPYSASISNQFNPLWDSFGFVRPQESEDEQIGPEQGLFLLRADSQDLPFREQQIDYAAWIVSEILHRQQVGCPGHFRCRCCSHQFVVAFSRFGGLSAGKKLNILNLCLKAWALETSH